MHILREVAAQFENPALLFSGGKDSIVCFHLARKAFHPSKVPFPLLHVDTGHNFEETMTFRDGLVKETWRISSSAVCRRASTMVVCRRRTVLRKPQQAADRHTARHHRETQVRLRHRRWPPR